MTIIVSINQFRQNMAEYIAKANEGHEIILEDEKKGQQIAKLKGKKQFNPETFAKALTAAAGVFTTESHPEWASKTDVIQWVEQGRKATDRNF